MDEKLFADLYESVKQMDQIRKGRRKPSRVRRVEEAEVKSIREKTGLSQSQFALLIGVAVGTYSSIFIASMLMYDTTPNKDTGVDLKAKLKR